MIISFALCQLNLTTGDFEGNFLKAKKALQDNYADVFIFPECQTTNYLSDDLFLNPDYVTTAELYIEKYRQLTQDLNKTIIIGGPIKNGNKKPFNGAYVIQNGSIIDTVAKTELPNYDVFDDKRWFTSGGYNKIIHLPIKNKIIKLGILICEDVWFPHVSNHHAKNGAEILVSLNSSPYSIAKAPFRRNIFRERVTEAKLPLIYVNQVGGNDELVWDGSSAALDPSGIYFESNPWEETVDTIFFDYENSNFNLISNKLPFEQHFAAERYVAACVGLRDYIYKNGFTNIVLGNSGGADSCLVALMAADVFGPEFCTHIMMPSQYTSNDSNNFAKDLAEGLGSGCKHFIVPIKDQFNSFKQNFETVFGSTVNNVAEENLQAQLRGDILSWYSNKFGAMILSTGNKSELALGYATLYGDMRGGFNPLKDLYKHKDVFELLRFRNEYAKHENFNFATLFNLAFGKDPVQLTRSAINAVNNITNRPPSAELAPGQKDTDSLPDYEVLDNILWEYLDQKEQQSVQQIADKLRYNVKLVENVINKLRIMEFKRFQSCPGPKIHRKAFTKKDWRMPLTNKWKGKLNG